MLKRDTSFEWYTCSYAADIEKYMKAREGLNNVYFQSPQLKYRTSIIDWIRMTAEKLQLSNVTVHLAVHLLDRFMDRHNIKYFKLHPVALICLLISAKYEESESRVPRLCDVSYLVEGSARDLAQLEVFLLRWLGWSLSPQLTPAHFAQYYQHFALLPADPPSFVHLVNSSVIYYLDLSLNALVLCSTEKKRYKPSEVGAACVLAARLKHGLSPAWPRILVHVTGYHQDTLISCLKDIIRCSEDQDIFESCCRKRKLNDSFDNGYESASPSVKRPSL